jgi:flagellin
MTLRINHNLSSLNANRNLKMTTESVNKSMQKLSSGFRINAAADDPAGLVISEQFRSQIAGLNRAIQNSEGSISMIQTAEGALTEINNLLISMRELAIHAANEGFNDKDQLAADQAEITNALKTIDRISQNTQFGTKKILDGSKDNIATITSPNSSGLNIKSSNLKSGAHSIVATKVADSQATLNTTSLGLSLANTDGDPTDLEEKIHQLDIVQASGVAKKTSSNVLLTDVFGTGLTLAATATVAMASSAGVIAIATASNVGTYTVKINYQENGASQTGVQDLAIAVEVGDTTATIATKLNSAIANNTALAGKLTATGTAVGILRIKTQAGAQFSIQTSASTSTASAALFSIAGGTSTRGVSSNVLNLTATTSKWTSGRTATATVAAATYTSMTTLNTAITNALATSASGGGGFGTVSGGSVSDLTSTVVNNTQIQFATRDEGSTYSIKLNAGSAGTGNLINVLGLTADGIANAGTDALVSFNNYTNTITSVKYSSSTSVTLFNKASGSANRGSSTFTVANAQQGVNLGALLLDVKAAKFDVRLDGGPATAVTAGQNFNVFNSDRTQSLSVNYALTSQGGSETINNSDSSLIFQIGGNVGQTANIAIRNMATTSLGKGIAGNSFTSLSKIDVTTSQGAQDAQAVIDTAINEVSVTRGTLGSFQKNTLESNLRNLRIASQNLTASESQIRDTDMAEEMSEFTKNQILVQAGTAMLAQANQMPQSVLSLFR